MLIKASSSKQKFISLFVFIIISISIKYVISLGDIRDYFTYTRVLSDKGHMRLRFQDLFFEPYFLFLSKILLYRFTIPQVLYFYYSLLFVLGLIFFSWLAFVKELPAWSKILIFNLFFILFTFVLLRNGIAYMMLALFFYYISKNRFIFSYFSAFLFHITAIPILFLSFFRNKKLNFYIIPIVFIIVGVFSFFFFSKYSIFYLKYKDFKINSIGYNYTIHNLLFVLSLSFFIANLIYYRNQLNNYFYVLLIIMYVILYYFNAVMGFRFSFYIILYLLMNTQLVTATKLERILNKLSFMFIFLGYLTLKLFLFN